MELDSKLGTNCLVYPSRHILLGPSCGVSAVILLRLYFANTCLSVSKYAYIMHKENMNMQD